MHAPEYRGLLRELPLVGASFKTLRLVSLDSAFSPPSQPVGGVHVWLWGGLNELPPETAAARVITLTHLHVKA